MRLVLCPSLQGKRKCIIASNGKINGRFRCADQPDDAVGKLSDVILFISDILLSAL